MSMFNQGIIEASDLPVYMVEWAEDKFFRSFGEYSKLEALIWFTGEKPIYWSFEDKGKDLTTNMTIEELFGDE